MIKLITTKTTSPTKFLYGFFIHVLCVSCNLDITNLHRLQLLILSKSNMKSIILGLTLPSSGILINVASTRNHEILLDTLTTFHVLMQLLYNISWHHPILLTFTVSSNFSFDKHTLLYTFFLNCKGLIGNLKVMWTSSSSKNNGNSLFTIIEELAT